MPAPKDVLINVDRAWEYWEDIIEAVERHGMAEQIILKSPAREPLLKSLETAGRRYMYMPMVTSKDEIDRVLSCNLNILAVEINFQSDDRGYGLRYNSDGLAGTAQRIYRNSRIPSVRRA